MGGCPRCGRDADVAIYERLPVSLSLVRKTLLHGDRPRVQTFPILRRTEWMLATDSSTVSIPCAVCCRPKISYRETVSPNLYIYRRFRACLGTSTIHALFDLCAHHLPPAAGTHYPTLCRGEHDFQSGAPKAEFPAGCIPTSSDDVSVSAL